MDNRWYFVAGDFLVNVITGAIVAWLCAMLINPSWNMFIAMLVCMPLGMLLAMIAFVPAGHFFGAMEVMVPLMLTGMYSGMIVGMAAAMHVVTDGQALVWGAFVGLVTIVLVWLVNMRLRGVRKEVI